MMSIAAIIIVTIVVVLSLSLVLVLQVLKYKNKLIHIPLFGLIRYQYIKLIISSSSRDSLSIGL
jgi:hypothetical protein